MGQTNLGFLLLFVLLVSYVRNCCPIQGHQRFMPTTFSKSFIVLPLQLRPSIHSELIFVYGVKMGSNLSILYMVIQFSQHHLL